MQHVKIPHKISFISNQTHVKLYEYIFAKSLPVNNQNTYITKSSSDSKHASDERGNFIEHQF